MFEVAGRRLNREIPPTLSVQQPREDRRRVERGEAHEIDRPVHAHQRRGGKIADNSIILDRLIIGLHDHITDSASANASVLISAFSAWRESNRVCWTTIGTSDSIILA